MDKTTLTKALHRKLSFEIEKIELDCVVNNDASELLAFLKRWWLEHINEEDRLYAQHVRDYVNKANRCPIKKIVFFST